VPQELRARREKIEKRLAMNMLMAEKIEEKRKQDFMEKQENFERLRHEHLSRQEQERMLHSQEVMLQEQRRHMILLQMRREEELAAERLLQKFDADEEQVLAVQKLRDKEHALLNEKKSLRVQMKLENVERVMRQGEYKKASTLKKIEGTDDRIKYMLQTKHSMVEERRRQAAATRVMKEKVAAVMEGVRSDASKASKVIAMAMSGTVPLREIATGEAFERRGPGAATSGGKKGSKKGSKKGAKSTGEMMGLTSRGGADDHGEPQRSRSAGDAPESAGDYSFNEFEGEGGDTTFATSAPQGSDEPLPYVSPYTLPQV
jgi:hypothetical protein